MPKLIEDKVMTLVRRAGVLRPRDLTQHDISRQYLLRLQRVGQLQKVGRGLYIASETHLTEHHSLVEACKRVPRGIICLLSALRFHNLTTQAPFEVWIAIDDKAWLPKVDNPRLRVVRFSGEALTAGIEEHVIEHVNVRIYGPAKTVADCFKYRNKIGLDVALEALRDCWRHRRATMDELWKYAKVCRVANVMRPYLESIA
jgi:predicted transcriptional regulator of viral defense system